MSIEVGDKIEVIKTVDDFSRKVGDTSTVMSVDSDNGSFVVRHDCTGHLGGNLWFEPPQGETYKPYGFGSEFKKVGVKL